MDLTGEYLVEAPVAQVWAALNDPRILKACIRDCTELNRESNAELTVQISREAGPLGAPVLGKVELIGIEAPNSGRLTCEWSQRTVDLAKASAQLMLIAVPGGTRLIYIVELELGTELSRDTHSSVETDVKQFLVRFAETVGRPWVLNLGTPGRPDANLVRWAELMMKPVEGAGSSIQSWITAFSPWPTRRRR